MKETDTIIWLKKKKQILKNTKKITVRLKSLNPIINIFHRLSNADWYK